MLLKSIIIVLMVAIIISLSRGLVFLFKDTGSTSRTMHSLGLRVTLAAALLATITYGFFTGQLQIGAPWDSRKFADSPEPIGSPINSPEPKSAKQVNDSGKQATGSSEISAEKPE